MDIALKLVSICAGERSFRLSRDQIMGREDFSTSRKVELVQLLEKKHQLRTYRLMIKFLKIVLSVIKFLSLTSTIAGFACIGAETEVFGLNVLYGLLFTGLAVDGYFMYNLVSDDLTVYRIELRRVRAWINNQ